MKKYKIIVNPISGRGTGKKSIPAIQQQLTDLNLDFDIVLTEKPWHASDLAEQAVKDGYNVVVAAGGDGTVNEVMNGLMRAQEDHLLAAAMGVLGVGRGNDFAYGIHVPHNLEKDCRILAEDHRVAIDVGYVEGGDYPQGRFFANGIGIGFDTVVGFEAAKLKFLTGFPSYAVAAIKTIFLYDKAPLVQIETDEDVFTVPALMVSVMNGQRMGGGFLMAPEGDPHDGLLDICIARQVSRGKILALIPHFIKGDQKTHPAVQMLRSKNIKITALEGSLPAHADGETLCEAGKELAVELLPQRLEIICDI